MGIYSRDYYREATRGSGGWGIDGLTPVVKFLLFANLAVFLLQLFVVRDARASLLEWLREHNPDAERLLNDYDNNDPEAMDTLRKEYPEAFKRLTESNLENLMFPGMRVSVIQKWFELDTRKVMRGQIWRLLTYAFCHDRYSILHIFFNMLCLYWFGGTLESMYGSREFLLFYLTGAVASGLAFVGLELYTGSMAPCIGASGAVMAVMMLYTMHFPRETICVCWFFPMEMRWVMALYAIWDLHPVLLALSGDRMMTGIAHAAHLGGLAFGMAYAKYQWRLDCLGDRLALPAWKWQRRPRLRLAPDTLPEPEPDADEERVDALLQKIYEAGAASLTEEERAFLHEASQRRKSRRGRNG